MYYHEDDRAQRLFDVFEVLDGQVNVSYVNKSQTLSTTTARVCEQPCMGTTAIAAALYNGRPIARTVHGRLTQRHSHNEQNLSRIPLHGHLCTAL
jgi:hypothetical protein